MEQLEAHFDHFLEIPDGIKKLRGLILTLAMQGKLVEQDPNDQPASELLKEIEAEKKRLVAEGKIKKPKPLPEIKPNEVPYELPSGWEWVRLGDITTHITKGSTPTTYGFQFVKSGIPFVKVENVKQDSIQRTIKMQFITKEAHDFQKRSQLKHDDLLFSIAGTIGETCIVKEEDLPANINQALAVIRGYKLVFDAHYLLYGLNSSVSQNTRLLARGAAMNNISLGDLKKMILPLPPLNEQLRIVQKIDSLMALCDQLESRRDKRDTKRLAMHSSAVHHLLHSSDENEFSASWKFIADRFSSLYSVKENVEELKKAILTLAMQGKLVEQDPNDQPARELLKEIEVEKKRLVAEGKIKKPKPLPEIKPEEVPYELPAGWEWVRISEICDLKTGATPSRSIKANFGGNIPWLVSGDINQGEIFECLGRITEMGLSNSNCKIIPKDSLYIALNGQGKTRATVAISRIDAACNQSLVAMIPFIQPYVSVEFLFWNLRGRYLELRDITGRDKRRGLNMKIISELLVPIAPVNVQHHIVQKIDSLMILCDSLLGRIDGQNEKSEQLVNAVLTQI